ncbi:MAG: FecR domain-containing protein [Pseudomonadota bacterium]
MSENMQEIRETANIWRSRVQANDLTMNERDKFRRWLSEAPTHAQAYAEAEILWCALAEFDPEKHGVALSDACSRKPFLERLANTLFRRPWQLPAGLVVITVALAFLLLPYLPEDAPLEVLPTLLETPVATLETVSLSDGSTIVLGAHSLAEVQFSAQVRRIRLLRGSAFFDVAKTGIPFVVDVGAARIRVTGTAFDVQRRDDSMTIGVAEGSVSVSHPTKLAGKPRGSLWERGDSDILSSATLIAGESILASHSAGLGEPFAVELDSVGGWRRGQLVYLRTRLADIVNDANRYSTVPIRYEPALAELRTSATFDANDIESLLEGLEVALPLRVHRAADVIRLQAKGE